MARVVVNSMKRQSIYSYELNISNIYSIINIPGKRSKKLTEQNSPHHQNITPSSDQKLTISSFSHLSVLLLS